MKQKMSGVVLTGHGGIDKLQWREDLPLPQLENGEILIQVSACGLNNTDVNTRVGWYSKAVKTETQNGTNSDHVKNDATWGGNPLKFPRIQGADIVGVVQEAQTSNSKKFLGKRVLVEPWIRANNGGKSFVSLGFIGSEYDGGFAQFVKVPASAAHLISSDLTDGELATFPTSSLTAENMLERARVEAKDTVLITGASGGVGSALVQLCHRRGAQTIALTSQAKTATVNRLNPTFILSRDDGDLETQVLELTKGNGVTVVADVVGGNNCPLLLNVLAQGGRFVCSGAIAGPIINLDLRTLYLKDLSMIGATIAPDGLFARVVSYIERGKISPLVAQTYPLKELALAQEQFIKKTHLGNIVVIP